jgi:hypothetical protein
MTMIFSVVVTLVACFIGIFVANFITRYISSLICFLRDVGESACNTHDGNDTKQAEQFYQLYEKWKLQFDVQDHDINKSSSTPTLPSKNRALSNSPSSKTTTIGKQSINEHSNTFNNVQHNNIAHTSRWTRFTLWMERKLKLHEVNVMQQAFQYMLWSLKSSYGQLQRANAAKRNFIRYIFHEVTNSHLSNSLMSLVDFTLDVCFLFCYN